MHKTEPIKTGPYGPKLAQLNMQNHPLQAAYFGGHELNESYKLPVPNASGENHSYMHPANNKGGGSNTGKLLRAAKNVAGPINTGKNVY